MKHTAEPVSYSNKSATLLPIEITPQFEGTCYKALNWEPVGLTKGFQRHRANYFPATQKRKTVMPIRRPNALRKKTPPFSYTEEPDIAHGRFDQRTISIYPFEALEANLPGARSIQRTRTIDPQEVPQMASYISPLAPEAV